MVVYGGGEGWFFDCWVMRREQLKSCPRATAYCAGCAAFLHNVIMAAQHHNATLCKEALEKKLLAQVTQCKSFWHKNCDSNFFRSVGLG